MRLNHLNEFATTAIIKSVEAIIIDRWKRTKRRSEGFVFSLVIKYSNKSFPPILINAIATNLVEALDMIVKALKEK